MKYKNKTRFYGPLVEIIVYLICRSFASSFIFEDHISCRRQFIFTEKRSIIGSRIFHNLLWHKFGRQHRLKANEFRHNSTKLALGAPPLKIILRSYTRIEEMWLYACICKTCSLDTRICSFQTVIWKFTLVINQLVLTCLQVDPKHYGVHSQEWLSESLC